MTTDELTIAQYWDNEEIPEYLDEALATFTDLNPDFRHMVFSRTAAEEFISEHFSPREVKAFRSCAVPSMQSDYFRFCAGLILRGVYLDVDYRCRAPLRSVVPEYGNLRVFFMPVGGVISGFYAFHAPGHPFLELALEIATVNIERRFPDKVYFATGPPIFTSLVVLYFMRSHDGSIAPMEDRLLQDAARVYWNVIGSRDRVVAALDSVELRPIAECSRYVGSTGALPYKETEAHWLNFKGDIFSGPEVTASQPEHGAGWQES